GERTDERELGAGHPAALDRAVEPLDEPARHLVHREVALRRDRVERADLAREIERRAAARARDRELEARADGAGRGRRRELVADGPERVRPRAPDDEPGELPDVDRRTEQGRPVEVRVTRVERDAAARRVRAQLAGESRESGRTGRGRDARAVEADA